MNKNKAITSTQINDNNKDRGKPTEKHKPNLDMHTGNNSIRIRQAQQDEHKSWLEMFALMCDKLHLSKEELNKEEYKPIFISIEKWAYYEYVRRVEMRDNKANGVFWLGELLDNELSEHKRNINKV
jgi:hypothetical protein